MSSSGRSVLDLLLLSFFRREDHGPASPGRNEFVNNDESSDNRVVHKELTEEDVWLENFRVDHLIA